MINCVKCFLEVNKNSAVASDVLKMTERCSDLSSVSSLRILVGILFGPADFLGPAKWRVTVCGELRFMT